MTKQQNPNIAPASRRKFLAGAAAATAGATLGFPTIVKAQGPVSMRWQSTWPSKDIFHEYALDFAKKVNDMTGGDLKIEVLPAGAVVPAFGLLDAVSKGTLDGGHGVLVYHYGKQNALALWGSGPAYGMDANTLLAWHKYGGGKELLNKLYASIGANVVSFPYGPMPTQPLGWFKKPITKTEDFKGLKFRTVGISIDVFTGLGAAVNALPGGEIVPAMDRGLLDAAEFNNASSDRLLGFADVSKVCMLQSYHQNAEQFEIMFNKTKYDALPEKMRAIIANAVEAASSDMSWKAIDRYSQDYIELQTKNNVQVLQDAGRGAAEAARGLRRGQPRSAPTTRCSSRSRASQRKFAERAVRWYLDTQVSTAHGVQPLLRQARSGQEGVGYADAGSSHPARAGWLFLSAGIRFSLSTGPSCTLARAMQKLLLFVDKVSTWVGHVFSFCIVVLTLHVSWEVFSRYALDNPRAWAFDAMIMLYGTLFMMAGAYTLAKNGHVRGDVLYGFFRPRTQATLDLILYVLFFLPGVIALTYAGYFYAADSWAIREHLEHHRRGSAVSTRSRRSSRSPGRSCSAGHRRDHPLRHLHQGRANGRRARRTSRKSTSTSSRRWSTSRTRTSRSSTR